MVWVLGVGSSFYDCDTMFKHIVSAHRLNTLMLIRLNFSSDTVGVTTGIHPQTSLNLNPVSDKIENTVPGKLSHINL